MQDLQPLRLPCQLLTIEMGTSKLVKLFFTSKSLKNVIKGKKLTPRKLKALEQSYLNARFAAPEST